MFNSFINEFPLISSLVGFALIITPLVFFHELGHFLLARHAGIRVEVFSVGFGRELFGWTDSQGTRWRLSLIPLGGYVKMREESSGHINDGSVPRLGDFGYARLWQRMAVVVAGPMANVLLAVVILFFANSGYGGYVPQEYHKVGLGGIMSEGPAARAGMMSGDVITHLNNQEIRDFQDIATFMDYANGASILVRYRRAEQIFQVSVIPQFWSAAEQKSRYLLGVHPPAPLRVRLGLVQSFENALQQTFALGTQLLYGIGRLLSGTVDYSEVGGPIKIAQFSGKSLMAGTESFLVFAAMLSINLALINMIPIPGLDGGHLLLLFFEALLRRRPSSVFVRFVNSVGILFILLLVVIVSVKDIYELFS